ncbi:hypothetical protein [Actinomadura rupiterrae]|uniref:hypothetical protein n=1 Tax=Actinomadura rupiterrae TaxID=559627 RepID=UPI0020A28453|nr:hypothetical protein [Actinomadura rupiterrae]MCP2343607.1 hypothetical protein [Actinomadura rupiterrae]
MTPPTPPAGDPNGERAAQPDGEGAALPPPNWLAADDQPESLLPDDLPGPQESGPHPVSPPQGPPAPEPFPYAQQIPEPPKPVDPFPYAQQIPDTPTPSAPEPFPYAQQIPETRRSSDPFPYAQEIPDNKPQAPEPFPYAQQIPQGGLARGPQPDAANRTITDHTIADQPSGFPYAQQIPGTTPPIGAGVQPVAPPPVIDEPWRAGGKSTKGAKRGVKKPLFIGLAGLVVVVIAAGGGFFLLTGDGKDGAGESVTVGDKVFPAGQLSAQDGRARRLTGVDAVGTTVVAVGGEDSRGWFLVSTDSGRTFAPAAVHDTDGDEPGPGEMPNLIAGSSRGWVAIGTRPGGGTVWTSAEGREWRRQPDPAGNQFGAKSHVKRLISTDSGFVAVGETSARGDFRDSVPAVWTSADGSRWEEHSGGHLGLPIRKGTVSLYDAAASGSTLLLEGIHTVDAKHAGRKIWRSTNGGKSWTESVVPVPKGTRGLVVGGGPTGFVALREVTDGGKTYAQAFLSKDGGSWTKAGVLQTPGYRFTTRIAGSDKGFAALVARGRDLLVSRSADGRTWQDGGTLDTPDGRSANGFALSSDQPVLVGQDAHGGPAALLAAWDGSGTRLPADPARVPGLVRPDRSVAAVDASAGKVVAVGSAGGDAAVWTGSDGRTWAKAKGVPTRSGPQRLQSVVSGKAGWLAVGSDQNSPRRPLVLTSADGNAWQAADSAAPFQPARNTALATYSAAAGPKGYVIVGEDGLSGAVWFSPDLKSWQRGRSTGDDGLIARPNSNRWLRDAASTPNGFVAVGGVRDPKIGQGPAARPGVWTSPDGTQWTLQRLPVPSGLADGSLTSVAARDSSLVALGTGVGSTGPAPVGYVSSDGGKSWRESRPPLPQGARDFQLTALTATPKGFVATGITGRAGTRDVIVWTSATGADWKLATAPSALRGTGDQEVDGLTVLDDSVLGVGSSVTQKAEQPLLWSRPVG